MGEAKPEEQGPLAEYNALRQEIGTRITLQHQVLALQLTTAGGLFTLVLTSPDRAPALLVVPLTTCLFAGHYLRIDAAIQAIASYCERELDQRVPGGLRWETWLRKWNRERGQTESHLRQAYPFLMAFSGTALLATTYVSVWTFFSTIPSEFAKVCYLLGIALGAILTYLSAKVVWNLTEPIEQPEDRENETAEDATPGRGTKAEGEVPASP